jgi:hypothetical protein
MTAVQEQYSLYQRRFITEIDFAASSNGMTVLSHEDSFPFPVHRRMNHNQRLSLDRTTMLQST